MARKLTTAQRELIADMRNGGVLRKMNQVCFVLQGSNGYNSTVQYKTYKTLVERGLLNKEINYGLTELGKTIELESI